MMFDEMGKEVALADLDLARELLAGALARHLDSGTVPPGILFVLLPCFGDAPVPPRSREPNLGAYNLDGSAPLALTREEC